MPSSDKTDPCSDATTDPRVQRYQQAIPLYRVEDGVPIPGALVRENLEEVRQFKVHDGDVIIAGYPRSGNHWVKEIVSCLFDFHHTNNNITEMTNTQQSTEHILSNTERVLSDHEHINLEKCSTGTHIASETNRKPNSHTDTSAIDSNYGNGPDDVSSRWFSDIHVLQRIPLLEMALDVPVCIQTHIASSTSGWGFLRYLLDPIISTFVSCRTRHVIPDVCIDALSVIRNRSSPRIYQTHLPYRMLPDVREQHTSCKIIVPMRNGKDVATSYFEMHKMYAPFGYYNGNWDDFIHTFCRGKVCFGSWFDHTHDWWKERHSKNILIVHYEDMHRDLHREIRRIATFLDMDINLSEQEAIANRCTFQNMKKNMNATYDNIHDSVNTGETQFLRKGKIGDWKNKMTKNQNEIFDSLIAQRLSDGPHFTFEK